MKKIIVLLLSMFVSLFNLEAQVKTNFSKTEKDNTTKKSRKLNAIGISVPMIWNNSNGIYYSLGNRREPTGKAFSYGINVNYSRTILKNWFANAGIGYFRQSFRTQRPFDFDRDPSTNFLYSTKDYSYDCIGLNAGIGYGIKIHENLKISALAYFNFLNSYKQKYSPSSLTSATLEKFQINNKKMQIGSMLNLDVGIEYMLSKRIGTGIDIIVPLITKWKDDKIFFEYLYTNDSQQIAENRFSIGTSIRCKYYF